MRVHKSTTILSAVFCFSSYKKKAPFEISIKRFSTMKTYSGQLDISLWWAFPQEWDYKYKRTSILKTTFVFCFCNTHQWYLEIQKWLENTNDAHSQKQNQEIGNRLVFFFWPLVFLFFFTFWISRKRVLLAVDRKTRWCKKQQTTNKNP